MSSSYGRVTHALCRKKKWRLAMLATLISNKDTGYLLLSGTFSLILDSFKVPHTTRKTILLTDDIAISQKKMKFPFI